MTLSKRHFLIATAALAMTAILFGALPTFAKGGGRTAGHADFQKLVIQIKGEQKTKIVFSKSQMAKFNSLKADDRMNYIRKVIARSKKIKWEYTPIDDKRSPGSIWCGKCVENKGRVQNKFEISGPEYKDGITALITASF